MNVAKRLSKLEALLGHDDESESNVLLVRFVKPGELDKRITHFWSKDGVDDSYLEDDESDDDFFDRATKYIREKNNINDNDMITMFGDAEGANPQTLS